MNPLHILFTFSAFVAAPLVSSAQISAGEDSSILLPPPPSKVDAGGDNVPNLGMYQIKYIADSQQGLLKSVPLITPKGLIAPISPAPLGWVLQGAGLAGLYLPDLADPVTGSQAALDTHLRMQRPGAFPDEFEFMNSDPSGSLDETALDANGDPIHFNLHYPQDEPTSFWLDDRGIDPSAPTDDLEDIMSEIEVTGSTSRIAEALDILLGTNATGMLTNKAYLGFPLLKYQAARVNDSYDPVTRNLTITQLWYGNEIYSDCDIAKVPAHGPYTITWKIRGLGDIGPNRERAFPIDEFTAIPMKKTSNGDFWHRNSWIWKWFNMVEAPDGRKYALENLYLAHTGTAAAPSYSDVDPLDQRSWLHLDRKFNLGSFVGEGDPFDTSLWQSYDLDLDGQIGGFLVNGTDTGMPLDEVTNPDAQFNSYGNNEWVSPRVDWSRGPFHIPYFGYDSSFATIRKGMGFDQVIRYGQGEAQAGIYCWGWRQHPPRINWIETYSEGQILASGAPKKWRFANKWDEIATLGTAAIGSNAPEKKIYDALLTLDASASSAGDISTFATAVKGLMRHVRDRRGLPPTKSLPNFPNPNADVNLLYTNLDIYGDVDTLSAPGALNWKEGDVIKFAVHNDDNFTRYFRTVDFGTTDYQFNGLDMGRFDWKPVYGFPQLAASGWRPPSTSPFGFGVQGLDAKFWIGTALEGKGNPFYVDEFDEDLANFWPAHERDLLHNYKGLEGFSGPGFTSQTADPFSVWANEDLCTFTTSDPSIWSFSYGRPIQPHTTANFRVEMPRDSGLNTGALYIFDPQFHASAIYTLHPTSEIMPEGLDD